MNKSKNNNIYILKNKKNYINYNIYKEIDTGLCLKGWEIKSIRNKKINICNSNILIINNELFLINTIFTPMINIENYLFNKKRNIKLLLHKKEIIYIYSKLKSKLINVIVLSIFIKNNIYAKLKIGIGKKKNLKIKKKEKYKNDFTYLK